MVSTAVLRRDKVAVEKVLAQHPESLIIERNVFGQSPIHLAIGWPDGLELLLRAADMTVLRQDLDVMSTNGNSPLDYPIAPGCIKSIRLLADADVAFDFNWNCCVGTDSLDPQVGKVISEASQLVLSIILLRLRQLLEFGRQKLPAEKIVSLQITDFGSFDSKASALLDCLHAEGIQVPRKLASIHSWLPFGGFFHQNNIGPGTATAFFEAGFTNVDLEVEQITPLMHLQAPNYVSRRHQLPSSRFYRAVEFFVGKGGRLDWQIPSDYINNPLLGSDTVSSFRVLHRLASFSWNGVIFFDSDDVIAVANLGSSPTWRAVIQSKVSDPCICACASGGCRPIALALKSSVASLGVESRWWHYFHGHALNWKTILDPQHWEMAIKLLSVLTLLLDGLMGEQLKEDVIRFLTFSALGLTHTCCHHLDRHTNPSGWSCHKYKMIRVMGPTEVEEIRDEEAELIEKLDCLVDGFMKDFRELGLPLSQFLLGLWQETVLAELSIRDETPESLRKQLSELGVEINVSSTSNGRNGNTAEPNKEFYRHSDDEEDSQSDNDAYAEWMSGIRERIRIK